MCVICVCYNRKMTEEEIDNCWSSNHDGGGIAFPFKKNKSIVAVKGLMRLDELKTQYAKVDILPHVVHFRITASGSTCPELTHPFIVSEASPLKLKWESKQDVLFHNGIITDWESIFVKTMPAMVQKKRKIPGGEWSDTRAAAVMCSLVGENLLAFLDGKYAYMNAKTGNIRTWGEFIDEKGIMFSNSSFRKYIYSTGNTVNEYYSKKNGGGLYPAKTIYDSASSGINASRLGTCFAWKNELFTDLTLEKPVNITLMDQASADG